MTTLHDTLTAAAARIEATGGQPADYDLAGLAATLAQEGRSVTDLGDGEFQRLLTLHELADQTGLPCPPWCQYEAGHPFEMTTADGRQLRPHSAVLASREGVDVALETWDQRTPGDDATATTRPPFVTVDIGGEYDNPAALRRLAGDLLCAADRLDAVTGDDAEPTRCRTCGAPMHAEQARCGLCAWLALPEGPAL